MLHAYFDNSENQPGREIATFAAGIATQQQWWTFEHRWLQALRYYGIESPFHATDFYTFAPPYELFRDHRELWTEISTVLVGIIKQEVPFAMAVSVEAAYDCVPKNLRAHPFFWEFRDGYTASMALCLGNIAQAARDGDIPGDDLIACVFDRDKRGCARNHLHAVRKYPDVYDEAYLRGSTKRFVPLQAADVLAYEAMKHIYNMRILNEKRSQDRKPLLETRKSGDSLFGAGNPNYKAVASRRGVTGAIIKELIASGYCDDLLGVEE